MILFGKTRASFRLVYIQLAVTSLLSIGMIVSVSRLIVGPALIDNKLAGIDAIIRSHAEDLIFQRVRPIRKALIEGGVVKSDNDLEYFLPGHRGFRNLKAACEKNYSRACISDIGALFFDEMGGREAEGRYAVLIKAPLNQLPRAYVLWETAAVLGVFLSFLSIGFGIKRRESELHHRLSQTFLAFSQVKQFFRSPLEGSDEYQALELSAEALAREYKALQSSVEQYKSDFKRKARLDQFSLAIGQMSHDLKAPLNETENFLEALPSLIESVPAEELRAGIDSILLRVRAGKKAFEEALLYTRRASLQMEEINVSDLLGNVRARALRNKTMDRLSIAVVAPDGIVVKGDSLKLQTALLNLVENSAEEMGTTEVKLEAAVNGGSLVLEVRDNGRGIPEEHLETIFQPLITFKAKGTGLGLFSSKEILSYHGGSIRALPSKAGAHFEIFLPYPRGKVLCLN